MSDKGGHHGGKSSRGHTSDFTAATDSIGNEFGGRGSEASGTRGGHKDTTGNSSTKGGHNGGGGFGVHGGSGTGQSKK